MDRIEGSLDSVYGLPVELMCGLIEQVGGGVGGVGDAGGSS